MSDTSRRGWRDSNWYVGLTGFLREYRKHRMGTIGIVILIGFVVLAVGAPAFTTYSPDPNTQIGPAYMAPEWASVLDPGGVVTRDYLEDPSLDSPDIGEIVTEGDPSQYSGDRFYAASEEESSNVTLTWSHVANETVNFRYPKDLSSNLPDTTDFIYYKQTFEWGYERLPKDVNITVEFTIQPEGMYATEEFGGRMFELSLWIIDSSGNWERVFKSVPPYTGRTRLRAIDLSFFQMIAGWRGMVAENGVQEDPLDELTIAVGLSPTYIFERNIVTGDEPWTYYNGSVTAIISELTVVAFGDYFGTLGTTDKGADAWAQLVYGSRISLVIGVLATALSTGVGVAVGMVAGYFGGKIDEILMRVVDFLLVIPGLPLMMVLAAFMGPSIDTIIVVIAILGWTGTSRLIRSQVLAEKNKTYVESARAIGASDTYIIFRHILPNVTPLLFANITLGVVGAILAESGLSFLGLTDPSEPSWGRMLADSQQGGAFTNGAWWVVIFPGLMITTISLGFTFIGHTLDQVLNPRLRER